ncbi:hypothetical protein glysoja_028199 [Glycine soja]|uniref:Pectinesterase inhibitor domain-containing protein n=1 Tax=Glycine soja TaxID=3848 RepID=A0A0B2QQQ8_GLYSO|nr:hypothetical protein glysoja_028199 [Glycine soja]
MNSLALCSLCLFLIAQSPWLTNATVFGDGSDLIGQICNENPEKKIECTNILRADPTVLDVPAIANCALYYERTIEDFTNSLNALKRQDPQTANYLADIAGDGPSSC